MSMTKFRVLDGQSIEVFNTDNVDKGVINMIGSSLKLAGGASATNVVIAAGNNLLFGGSTITIGGLGPCIVSLGKTGDVFNLDVSGVIYNVRELKGNPNIYLNGNVGIGIASIPKSLLDVDSIDSDIIKARFHTESATTNALVGVGFGVDSVNKIMKSAIAHQRKDVNGKGDLVFYVDGSTDVNNVSTSDERMRLDSSGRLGIGRTPTLYPLEVAGDIYAVSGWFRTGGSTGWFSETHGGGWYMTDANYLRSYNSKSVWVKNTITANTLTVGLTIENNTTGDMSTTTETAIDFIHTDTGTTNITYPRGRVSVKEGTTGALPEEGGDMLFSVALGSGTNAGTLNERMRIRNDGNIGIGTSSPSEKLHVVGDVRVHGGGTIGGANIGEGWLVFDNGTGVTLGIDNNEIYGIGDHLYIGNISSTNDTIFRQGGVNRGKFTSGGLFLGVDGVSGSATVNLFSTADVLGATQGDSGRDTVVATEKAVKQYIKVYAYRDVLNIANLNAQGLVGEGSGKVAAGDHTHGSFEEMGVGSMYKFVVNSPRKALDLVFLG